MSSVHQQHGFTLIELMVAITIMTLLFGSGVVSYLKFNDNQQVVVTGQKIQQMLRTAQKKARVGDKPTGCNTLNAYQLSASAVANAQVRLDAVCNSGNFQVESYTLPSKVTFSQGLSMRFKVLTGGTDQPGTIQLNGDTGTTFTFTVGAGGDISEGVTVVR